MNTQNKWRFLVKLADRAESEFGKMDRMSLMMDLNSIPDLDLESLLDSPLDDFAHDIGGIVQYMDRRSYPGKLKKCFVPRFTIRR